MIGYRPYRAQDHEAVSAILYRTGFLGEDLAGTGLFEDRALFALINTEGYLRYHPSSAFVAFDETDGKVIGYVMGAPDTRRYQRVFARRMQWRINLRAFLVSWWKHPESFRQALQWARAATDLPSGLYDEYPAHLHINVLPEYQRLGIGERLIRLFEQRMASRGVRGIHLITSNRNRKALPFYLKNGFEKVTERPGSSYRGVENHVAVVFAKRLKPCAGSTEGGPGPRGQPEAMRQGRREPELRLPP